MAEQAGSENPFQRLYMRQLSLNLDVLSSILSRLFMEGEVWTMVTQDLQLRVLGEEELSTALVPRANTSEETSMPVEYEKEEEGPPEMEQVEPEPIKLEAEEISDLLDIVHDTADLPSLMALNQAAMINLTIMAKEVQEELDKRAEEMKKKADEHQAKVEAWKAKKAKEREDEEKKAREKAHAA